MSLFLRIQNFIKNPRPTQFETLALELFQYQFEKNPGYHLFCLQRHKTPQTVKNWHQIPALPQAAFKQSNLWLSTFHKKETKNYFETSGTTADQKGKHFFKNLEFYQLATTYGFRFAFEKMLQLKKSRKKILFLFLKESPEDTPHSSLSHMFGIWKKNFGLTSSEFLIQNHFLDSERLTHRVSQTSSPIFLAGTALAFTTLLQTHRKCILPLGSMIMETGGFKGKTREIQKGKFYQALSRFFKISLTSIYNEYGMTELFSQAYACGMNGNHHFPPWLRFRILNPETGEAATDKTPGIIELIDLANAPSCLAIQTQDLGINQNNTLQLLGRISQEKRGCSLTAEDLRL